MAAGRFCFRKYMQAVPVRDGQFFTVPIRFVSTSKAEIKESFPWKQHYKDVFPKDRLFHRLIGMFLFRRMLKHARIPFDLNEFAAGVREAVKVVSVCLCNKDMDSSLQSFLGSVLYRQFKVGFGQLKQENKDLYLRVAAIANLQIAGARFLLGNADPGDEYIFETMGQKIILSKSEVEDFEEEHPGDGLLAGFKYGIRFGEGAIAKQVRFQFDVKFQTKESMLIDTEKFIESKDRDEADVKVCYHKWTFESPVNEIYNDGTLLDWTIVDMNDYVKYKFYSKEKEIS